MSAPFRQHTAGLLPHLPLNRQVRNRLRKRNHQRFAALERAARSLVLDPLEPRVLLNADVLALDLSAMYQDNRDHELLVRLHEDVQDIGNTATTVQRVQIVDRDGGAILAFGDLSEINSVSILGGGGNESFFVDDLLHLLFSMNFLPQHRLPAKSILRANKNLRDRLKKC